MTEISRRTFLCLSVASPFICQFSALATQSDGNKINIIYPRTIAVLQESFTIEMIAYKRYIAYTSKALTEKYPNIAYLFYSLSHSEKIHADNYRHVLATLGREAISNQVTIEVGDTKTNLQKASQNELTKIQTTYPNFVKELESEACEEAITSCVYSWKSHQQHERKVREIEKFSGMLFGSVSNKIEGLSLDFHVCRVCGSTIDKAPDSPCVICDKSKSNYEKIERPV
jgi:rubrerythrin